MYIWILTVMLSYGSIVDIKTLEHVTETGTLHFKTLEACEDYIYKNKVVVVKDLLQHFDNGQLTGFDFMCESQWYD